MFFFDGNEIHVAAIERILQKLRNIIELIKLCDSVRLYCCSLLLVYESDKTAKLNYKVIITDLFLPYQPMVLHRSDSHNENRVIYAVPP